MNNNSNNISVNVHLDVPQQAPGSQPTADGSHTPNTPEILNSIVNMQSGPFASYANAPTSTSSSFGEDGSGKKDAGSYTTSSTNKLLQSPEDAKSFTSNSSPASTPSSAISVQQYRSQFIKEGLKMKVQQKLGQGTLCGSAGASSGARRVSETAAEYSTMSPLSSPASGPPSVSSAASFSVKDIKKEELTEEDELRRMRRRERNKVAATKCRNKKKQRTILLVKESETLEVQNHNLKMEINKLEKEKKRLMEVLSIHEPTCAKRLHQDLSIQQQQQQQQQQQLPPTAQDLFTPSMESSSSRNFHLTTDTDAYNDDSLSIIQSTTNQNESDDLIQDLSSNQTEEETVKYHDLTPYNNRDIRPELQLNDVPMTESSPPGFMRGTSCCFDNPNNSSSASGFLDKRPLRHSFLNLDSRCIAL